MRVLGLETSCDDTGVAVYDSDHGLLAHKLYSQSRMHAEYGGVVPELASRDHIRKLLPLVREVLAEAAIAPPLAHDPRKRVPDVLPITSPIGDAGTSPIALDGVAYTMGPGLAGALLVAAAIGRSLAYAWGVPAIGVHHMEGHLLAPMLETEPPAFPFLALLVSGGHTLLVDVRALGDYRILGESVDDAVGEAFDKTAKLLGLGYPGGPAIARAAAHGTPGRFRFPRPMTDRPGLDFSFSGLKTAALTAAQHQILDARTVGDIAHAFQEAAVETLVIKCERALQQTGLTRLVVAGGVGANQWLRSRLAELGNKLGAQVYYPRPAFCTDNGAMIAYAGCVRLRAGQQEGMGFGARARWNLTELTAAAPG